jgi:shikimate dehydrogenase
MGSGAAAEAYVDVDLAALSTDTVVCDLNPETAESAFLRFAAARGHRTLDGLGMLARQGAAGFKAWTGVDAPLEVMIKALGG